MRRFIFLPLFLMFLFVPVMGFAAGNGTTTGIPTAPTPSPGTTTPAATPSDNKDIGTFSNPVGSANAVDFGLRVMKLLVAVAGMLTTIVIIVSGFRLALADGNTKVISDARSAITYAIIGLVLAALSFGIIGLVQNALNGKF